MKSVFCIFITILFLKPDGQSIRSFLAKVYESIGHGVCALYATELNYDICFDETDEGQGVLVLLAS